MDEHIDIVRQWYETGKVTDLHGNVIEGLTISSKHKQSLIRRIFSSFTIPQEDKDRLLAQLIAEDSSDWTQKT